MESTHFQFPVDAGREYTLPAGVRYITGTEVPELTALDERLLRERLASAPEQDPSRTAVAILPDKEHMLWHFNREGLKAAQLYPSTPLPDVHGAIVTTPSSSSRIWTLWSRKLRSRDVSANSLYFLRFVIEKPEDVSDEELGDAFEKIVEAARKYAKESACGKVQMWTPGDRVRKVAESRQSLKDTEHVVRETDSIVSLNWFGEGSVDDVDWIIPEQYTWC